MRRLLVAVSVGSFLLLGSAASAAELSPWWHLTSGARPSVLSSEPGARGAIVLTALNVGDGQLDAETSGVRIHDTLPPGLEATAIEAISGKHDGNLTGSDGPVSCVLASVTCTYEGSFVNGNGETVPEILPAYDQIEVRIKVKVLVGFEPFAANEFSVSGGGAAPASLSRPLAAGEEPAGYGLEEYSLGYEEAGGAPVHQAGSHPFQQTVDLTVNQGPATGVVAPVNDSYEAHPVTLTKDVMVGLPAGVIGNPSPFTRCTLAQFHLQVGDALEVNACPPSSAVGVAIVTYEEPSNVGYNTQAVPVFNIEPRVGEPARFAFSLPVTSVFIDTSLRSAAGPLGEPADYGVTASTTNINQAASLISSKVIFWGVPGDARHDTDRGWACMIQAHDLTIVGDNIEPCQPLAQEHPPALLTMPTSCAGSLSSWTLVDSWLEPAKVLSFANEASLPALDGCDRLPFSPTVSAEPTTDRASAPSGLDVNLDFHDEGLVNAEGLAQSHLDKAVVTLPEGLTINPSAGVGLQGCSPADYARETLESEAGAGCPNESKLGTVEVTTPLLSTAIHGSLYIAEPYENPFDSLVALYVVLRNPETGVLIKLAGRVTPNPVTGQLTTTFENNPQLPFDHFNFHFREGQQAPLVSPPACGTYETTAGLSPWSNPATVLTDTSQFTITKGYDGGACPAGGVPPFTPQIEAGTTNNNAGGFSPFYLRLTRTDAEQEISVFSTSLPAGLTGVLAGVPFCPEADIALARSKSGDEELAAPSCPAATQVGHTLVGTGVGAVLAYVPGKIYLAGPYGGDPFSLVSVTSAVVGPFDLGTVVIRFGLRIDPHTAQVSVDPAASEPIPHIIKGIVTHVRDIRVYIDRPNFTMNPTSCSPLQISSTLTSNLGQSTTIASPFQAASCTSLRFTPRFQVSVGAHSSKALGASLTAKLSEPAGAIGTQANITKVKVALPKQLPSQLKTLQKACLAQVFETNPAACPAESIIGHASVITPLLPVPLTGPAYFVSHGGEAFPSLTLVLQGYGVTVQLTGTTNISKGITSTTFKTVPDVPFNTFELTLPQGQYAALAAYLPASAKGSLCGQNLKMPTEMIAQNGLAIYQQTPITATGCPKTTSRAQKLAAALKACKHKPKNKRATCTRQARRKYTTTKGK